MRLRAEALCSIACLTEAVAQKEGFEPTPPEEVVRLRMAQTEWIDMGSTGPWCLDSHGRQYDAMEKPDWGSTFDDCKTGCLLYGFDECRGISYDGNARRCELRMEEGARRSVNGWKIAYSDGNGHGEISRSSGRGEGAAENARCYRRSEALRMEARDRLLQSQMYQPMRFGLQAEAIRKERALSVDMEKLARCFSGKLREHDTCCLDGGWETCFDAEYTYESCCDRASLAKMSSISRVVLRARRRDPGSVNVPLLFADVLIQLGLNGTWAEVGVLEAEFSSQLLELMHNRGDWNFVSEMYLIDNWRQYDLYFEDGANLDSLGQVRNLQTSLVKVAPFWNKVRMVQVPSVQAARLFEDASLDFVYLDARHDYCGVVDDILAYWPKLRPQGLMAGDDFGWSTVWQTCDNGSVIGGGVKRAVEEVMRERLRLELIVLDQTWLVQKPEE
eukprot:TRINITY_DN97765_c0_g1_i1.p1 TRINITY_DN97765_c0_g1~~TRINITY_DN97765_c0_g1_i1.p1  ORF type:complete len:458 (+),score=92.19 TRINITY_DN97765_c0_g1_i1:40-1374(+)